MLALVQFSPLHAQDLSGKWKGYFIPNNDPESRIYIYEVDIIENENHDLNVVTYTNLSGNFSAKAIATGFYSVNTKLVSINETKFEDINIVGDMQACLMMNFLTFTNNRGRGILQGTYISNNEKGTRDCGGGKVYLEKEDDDPSQPVIWRGPMVGSGISQLLSQSDWGELDYLLVDLPPGTGDATLTLAQRIPLSGVVIVSQPQRVSLDIAIKALKAFQSLKVRILGVLENMSTFVCDDCGKEHHIFSHGGARLAAEQLEVPFLGDIPLSLDICEASDAGTPVVSLKPDSAQAQSFMRIAEGLAAQVSIASLRQRTTIPLRAV